jgi:hypothetical protein
VSPNYSNNTVLYFFPKGLYFVAFDDQPVKLLWHRLDGAAYRLVEPDEDGILRSRALPNFWLPLKAIQERDWWGALGCIERGVSRRANFS